MAKHSIVSASYAREALIYDPETGILIWRTRPLEHFRTERGWRRWNRRYVGQEAGMVEKYRRIKLGGRFVMAHRLAWLFHYGDWPSSDLDHIDRDKLNNRIGNLRVVTRAENARNARRRRDNTSGVTGVSWRKRGGRWVSFINADGRRHHLGQFESIESATVARRTAERLLGFPKHKEGAL